MIHFNLMKAGQLPLKQDLVEVLEEHFISPRGQVVLHKALTLIPMKYSKCSFLGAAALRCRQMSFLTKLMMEVTPSPRYLEVRKWVEQEDFLACFPLCKVVVQVQLEVCLEGISILGSHLQGAALVQLLLQDFNSKSISQMINKSKRNEGINLIY